MNAKKAKRERASEKYLYGYLMAQWQHAKPAKWRFISYHFWKKKKPIQPKCCRKAMQKNEKRGKIVA